MKKVLCFAAAALILFAGCQKTTVVYDNGGQQEIAFFAVNKTATKAPVSNTTFPETYAMQVAAYLAAGDGVAPGGRNYFDETKFTKPNDGTYWTGGKYWPLSAATLNFIAVAPEVASSGTGTPAITTTFGETNTTAHTRISYTIVSNNNTDQYDVMYATGTQTKTAGNAPTGQVGMTFEHAYSWLVFKFSKASAAPEIIIKDITVNEVSCDGTLSVTVGNADGTSGNFTATPEWTGNTSGNLSVYHTADLTLSTTPTEFSNGLLVIPSDQMSKFVITYTIAGQEFTYTYTPNPAPTWDPGKKYIFNITMSPSLIEINPEVEKWDGDHNGDGDEDEEDDEDVNLN